ncbi:MAG: YihY/virulence factor BrkB family protein [Actinomycetota bacterium]|nr:YihY/virulence factor BrkB family protein [Actinomycetota bacterium]
MSFAERVDNYQRNHRLAGFPIAVVYKFFDDQGNYLAALITYYAFWSLFPMLLLASSILGFILQGNADLQNQLLDSTLSRFPVIGTEISTPTGLRGSGIALTLGVLGSIYGALGVAQASQNAMNIAWAVPRNRRPNPVLMRARSVLLLATGGVAVLATTIFSTVASSLVTLGFSELETWLRFAVLIATMLLNALVFAVLFRIATAHKHSLRQAAAGALFVATVWQVLQLVGTAYAGRLVQGSMSDTNGVFAVVLGMLAWIFIGAVAVVFGVEINVVRAGKLYPRALLTPFTDNVDLTPADRLAYTRYAQGQRHKGFQSVSVEFDERARPAAKDDRESSG